LRAQTRRKIGFAPDALLILAPSFQAGCWIRLLQREDLLGQFF